MTEDSPATDDNAAAAEGPSIRDFQRRIEQIYYERDAERGLAGTYMWFVEEVGELARSFISGTPASDDEEAEFADCLAWLSTLASIRGVDLCAAAWKKYGAGCPRCKQTPCNCQHRGEGASGSSGE